MKALLLVLLFLPLAVQAQPVTVVSSVGTMTVTESAITYQTVANTGGSISRDILASLPRSNEYQWTAKDLALIVDVFAWEGNEVPAWPSFAADDILTLLAELEVAVNDVIAQVEVRNAEIAFLQDENAALKAELAEAGDTSALEAEIAALRETNASLAAQLGAMSQANEAAIVLLTRLLNAVRQ
jgi:hypothetical protein